MDMVVMTGQKTTEGRTGPFIGSFLWWPKTLGTNGLNLAVDFGLSSIHGIGLDSKSLYSSVSSSVTRDNNVTCPQGWL